MTDFIITRLFAARLVLSAKYIPTATYIAFGLITPVATGSMTPEPTVLAPDAVIGLDCVGYSVDEPLAELLVVYVIVPVALIVYGNFIWIIVSVDPDNAYQLLKYHSTVVVIVEALDKSGIVTGM